MCQMLRITSLSRPSRAMALTYMIQQGYYKLMNRAKLEIILVI